ncbi:hypothetical protein ACFVWZ_09190 [Streptomyces sp. NPDC058200]|uniref:hypothetical protein n=1 Tax=Streptomyces sp. NPDC058200 TaxID=3346378 RepID=UPI0036E082DE
MAPENPESAAVAHRSGFVHPKQVRETKANQLDWYIRDLPTAAIDALWRAFRQGRL